MIISKLKKLFYFPIAYYFRFFAKIQLAIWKPTIIVVTGSSGKTTLLHIIESQIQEKARYSHQANSSYGIPFDILCLHRKNLTIGEWPYLFLAAPFRAFKTPPKEKIYVVEADCDRPNEGKFLATLLKPDVTLWTNVGRTHTVNFDSLVKENGCHCEEERRSNPPQKRLPHPSTSSGFAMTHVEQAIAYEFGYFLQETISLAIVNNDSELIKGQIHRSKARIKTITQTSYSSSDQAKPKSREVLSENSSRQARTINPKTAPNYKVFKDRTEFNINGTFYKFNALLPKETSYSIQMTLDLLDFLKIKPDLSFSKFSLPPGRCSAFKGIKNTTIIDSSYNATPDGVRSILEMFDQYPNGKKWLVLGDMIELGNEEKEEHEKLADTINSMKLDKIILVGPRLRKYTYPKLEKHIVTPRRWRGRDLDSFEVDNNDRDKSFLMPKDALDYLLVHLRGGEAVLFKGARFLEGIIEHLLTDKNDIKKLCRREKVWEKRRKQWEL